MIRAVVFDCFGVILTDVLSEIRAELAQRDPGAAEEIRGIIAANNRGLIEPRESNEQIASLLGMDPHVFRQQVREGETKNLKNAPAAINNFTNICFQKFLGHY
jgi:hypothetical protein